jgi:hypothetical protein
MQLETLSKNSSWHLFHLSLILLFVFFLIPQEYILTALLHLVRLGSLFHSHFESMFHFLIHRGRKIVHVVIIKDNLQNLVLQLRQNQVHLLRQALKDLLQPWDHYYKLIFCLRLQLLLLLLMNFNCLNERKTEISHISKTLADSSVEQGRQWHLRWGVELWKKRLDVLTFVFQGR